MFPHLRAFVAALEQAGELHRVRTRVSPILEIAHVADRVSKTPAPRASESAARFDPRHHHLGGKALLFEDVEGSRMPVLINAYGSYTRVEMALGCAAGGPHGPAPDAPPAAGPRGLDALAAKLAQIIRPEPPVSLWEKLKAIPQLLKIASYPPRVVDTGRCQEVVKTGDQLDLFDLPVLKCWPLDGDPAAVGWPVTAQQAGVADGGGRFITFGAMYTIHPADADRPDAQPRPSRNVGMYRAQLLDSRRTVMHWHLHHDGARHWRAWKSLGKPMPLAIVFGGQSVLPYAATAPMPPGVSELLLAGFLNDGGIDLVRCKTIDLHVPASAEIVIEGTVSTDGDPPGLTTQTVLPLDRTCGPASAIEGPFGDHTGFYSMPDRYPIFTATAITHGRDPIFPATVVGPPPMEDYFLGKATERLFLPLLRTLVPDILDYHLPMFGAFHNCAFVKIRKEYPLQARKVMHAIWGAGQMAWTKFLVVVDETVDVHDDEAVWFHWAAHCDPGRDVEVVSGPLDILDHAAPRLGAGHKMGFDATRKAPGEEAGGHAVRPYPPAMRMSPAIQRQVAERWGHYGL